MLNRRILRVKAFQNLYAFEQCKASNLNLAKDQIKDAFLPDLNTMEVQDKSLLKKEAALATELFLTNLNTDTLEHGELSNPKILQETRRAINYFHKANQKDLDFLSKNMITSAERIPQLYLYAIQLLVAFSDHVGAESERKKRHSTEKITQTKGDLNFANNKILQTVRESAEFQAAVVRQGAELHELELEIKEWFRNYVKVSESYQEYTKLGDSTLEDDFEIVDDILKKILFKVDAILNFFAEKDLNWTENKSVVRSLAAKVLKKYQR